MRNRNKIFSDLSKFAVDAMSAFSGIREEIETIVSLRVNKIIKKMNLVKKDDFDLLNNTISKLGKDIENLKKQVNRPIVTKKKSSKKKSQRKRTKKRT
tara:strand:- start:533 stop:826 length:294 start_codon:yes stop_codon:yes gene_type:complete